MHWSDKYTRAEFHALVRKLAEKEGLSASKIAAAIGLECTKNTIIRAAHDARPRIKLGEKRRAAIEERKRLNSGKIKGKGGYVLSDKPKRKPKVRAPVLVEERPRPKFIILAEITEDGPMHKDDARIGDGRCRFPLWPHRMGTQIKPSKSEQIFCGKRVEGGGAWCQECRRKVYLSAGMAK